MSSIIFFLISFAKSFMKLFKIDAGYNILVPFNDERFDFTMRPAKEWVNHDMILLQRGAVLKFWFSSD